MVELVILAQVEQHDGAVTAMIWSAATKEASKSKLRKKSVFCFVIDFNYKVFKNFVIFKAILGPKDRKYYKGI